MSDTPTTKGADNDAQIVTPVDHLGNSFGSDPAQALIDEMERRFRDDTAETTDTAPDAGDTGFNSPADTEPDENAEPNTDDTAAVPTPDDDAASPDTNDATPPTADATEPTTTPEPAYTWNDGGETYTFTDAQVQQGLVLQAWAERLDDTTRTAFAAIEHGQAVAIPRADYDQFVAWRDSASRSARDADLERLDVDPDVAKMIATMRDEIDALRGTAQPGALPNQPAPTNLTANLDATAQRLNDAVLAYGTEHHLSQADTQALFAEAVNANVIPIFSQEMATFNPVTGELLSPADPATVARRALDYAMFQRANRGIATPTLAAEPPATPSTPTAADDALTAKKARAASVASAPSAPTPTPSRNQPRSPQEQREAIAAELAAAMGVN